MRTVRLSPDGRELAGLLPSRAPGDRVLLGITGAPGAGKSTLAVAIAAAYAAVVVPMDGFHLADVELVRRGLLDRKGAPETFDPDGYAALLARIRARPDRPVMAPLFERDLEQPLANAIPVPPSADLVVTEGNYLLLDEDPWPAVRAQLDAVWHVVADDAIRLPRARTACCTSASCAAWPVASASTPSRTSSRSARRSRCRSPRSTTAASCR